MTNEFLLTDGQRLLRRILECPEDDAVRLIYSDWLEEQGFLERAQLIRLQIEDARIPIHECDSIYPGCTVYDGRVVNHDHKCRGYALRERIREVCGPYTPGSWGGNFWDWFLKDYPGPISHEYGPTVTRGFISSVSLTCEAFVGGPCQACDLLRRDICPRCNGTGRIEGVARELFSTMPITEVRLVGKRPGTLRGLGGFFWEPGISFNDPRQVPFDFGKAAGWKPYFYGGLMIYRFDTEADANAALSRACVDYGRNLVGLPPLVGRQ